MSDEFYIGYEAGIPPRMRSLVVRAVIAVAAVTFGIALWFVSQQRPLADARFDYGTTRAFTGYLTRAPAPSLRVVDGEATHVYWLVAPGKFGAAAALGDVAEGWVTLSGALVEREQWRMIEVMAGSVRARSSLTPPPSIDMRPSGPVVLTGEIVDGKCYLGVMNPGERGVHRDCAVRCLSGGVPAMFAFHDPSGSHLALVVGAMAEQLIGDAGRTLTLSGLLSGPEDARVFAVSQAQ